MLTLSHRTKNGVYSPFETVSTAETGSPTPRSNESRRTSRRWAATSSPKREDDEPSPSLALTLEPDLPPHVVETLVANLLDPPDLDQRMRDYDWYIHYQDDEVLGTGSTAEPQDLQLYVRAAQLASGQEPDELSPGIQPSLRSTSVATEAVKIDTYEPPKTSLTYYENWLHAE